MLYPIINQYVKCDRNERLQIRSKGIFVYAANIIRKGVKNKWRS